ncbi:MULTISPECIES: NB-ARC domain-containing protein [Actinosynnema]|uniref:ATP-binding protein n=1 Tax=Actinosynnema TaxID=40566 RepID=UPI0020A2A405|nr:NB-ARC domain-containing protein [Actinosynnema pretiosum]MCP2092246.1 putative ATPase [Actinosynnema pretiosum]
MPQPDALPPLPAKPRRLPPEPTRFVGRDAELERLDVALLAAQDEGVPPVLALAGAGGVGKTWLAVRWAHRNAGRFPDGQLFVDLRGFTPDGGPMETSVAVRGFLDALGVEPSRIPADLHDQAGLYRSLLADRRVLVVLDNAASAEQVAPLLPGGRSSAVIVTSRNALRPLFVQHDVHHERLPPLTADEAEALLTARLGAQRVAEEREAVAELVSLCRGSALALALVASRARLRPRAPLAGFAAELRESGLAALDDDDPAVSLPAVLSWSYDALPPERRRLFALIGLSPGPDLSREATASLVDLPPSAAAQALRALEEASLLEQDERGRYSMHDLVRVHALAVAHEALDADEREAALTRLLDHYARTAHACDRLLAPHRQPLPLPPPARGALVRPPAGTTEAMSWLAEEHPNLLAAQESAASAGEHHTAWLLAWGADSFHGRCGHLRDRVLTWQRAVESAEHLAEPMPLIRANRFLGRALAHLGRRRAAVVHLHKALELAEAGDDRSERAHSHRMLAWVRCEVGDDERGLADARLACELFRDLDQPVWEAAALTYRGLLTARLLDRAAGRADCEAALELYRAHPNPDGEATTRHYLAVIEHGDGRHREAAEHCAEALRLYRGLHNTNMTADVLEQLGEARAALGAEDSARTAWKEALVLYEGQGREDAAERVRGLLG